jgi:hypothetical protein
MWKQADFASSRFPGEAFAASERDLHNSAGTRFFSSNFKTIFSFPFASHRFLIFYQPPQSSTSQDLCGKDYLLFRHIMSHVSSWPSCCFRDVLQQLFLGGPQ